MKFKVGLIFLFCLGAIINVVWAQEYNFINIGTNKGMPSSECYGLLQDSKGYMWVRTLNGLCKYDGKKFKVFTKKDGLKSNATYALYEDKNGRIWFSTSSSHIGYISNDTIHYLKCSERLAQENGFGQKIFYKIILDNADNIYISSHEKAYKINAKDKYASYNLIVQNGFFLKLIDIDEQLFFVPDTVSRVKAIIRTNYEFSILDKVYMFDWDIPTIKKGISRTSYPCKDKFGNIFFNLSHKIYRINTNGTYKEYNFENLVYHIFIDKDNNLWVGFNSGGIYLYDNCDISNNPKIFLKNESISGFVQDFEGGIWASSLNKGIFYCKNLHNENLIADSLFNFKPELLKVIDSTLYLSDFKSGIVFYDILNKNANFEKLDDVKIGIIDIDKTDDGFILSGRNSIYKVDKKLQQRVQIIWNKSLNLSSGSYNTIISSNRNIWGVSKNFITNYTSGNAYKLSSYGNDILEFNNAIYVATKNELLKFAPVQQGSFSTILENENVLKLLPYKNSLLLLCRDGKIFQLDKHKISKIFYTDRASFNDACLMEHDRLLIASNYGIYIFDLSKNLVRQINTNEGLLDNEIFKIAVYKNKAYYSTIQGIGIVDIELLKANDYAPKIILSNFRINNHIQFLNQSTYPFNSSINLKFDVISFKDNLPPKLIYKLNGYDSNWKSSESAEINYTNLPNGAYNLQVYAQNLAGVKSKVNEYKFNVALPFYKTGWFVLTLIFALIILSYTIYKISYYFINKREVKKTKINKMLAEYQLMGLKAQMNPHFIFNCLNSIQKYVLEHDSKLAYTYMAKFSKLIRIVLDLSDKTFVALSDELDLVRIYVELEQLRFDKKFDFEINIDGNVKADDVLVPSLLIQPYLENAIWHGIMNLNGLRKGEIIINAVTQTNLIEISISDNGVGRATAKLLNQSSHQSKGISINDKRIEAINYLLKSRNATIQIVDIFDQNNQPHGTNVIIKLPLKYDE
jgi:sensor histidine kinase YesM